MRRQSRLAAEYELKQDPGRGLHEDPTFLQLRQLHTRIFELQLVKLRSVAIVSAEAEADMVDDLTVPVDVTVAAWNEVYDWLAAGLEPVAWESERRTISRRDSKDVLDERACALEVACSQRYVVERDGRARLRRCFGHARSFQDDVR
jgi:hypothetical protein